jgi:hypothetical protein
MIIIDFSKQRRNKRKEIGLETKKKTQKTRKKKKKGRIGY